MNLRFWAATDTGRVRDHNEDNFLVDKNLQLFVVCDGMGGHAAGEVASAVCVRTVRDVIAAESELLEQVRENPDDTIGSENLKSVLRRAVKTGNARIFEMAQQDRSRRGMGTTCTALVLAGGRGFVGHVGDSRMYRLRDGSVEQITDDHSLLNEMIRQGKVSPETTEEEFQHQNAVTRAVGVRQAVEVDAFRFDIEPGDRLLMCSDGLSEYLPGGGDLAEMFDDGDPRELTSECIEFANESGGKDNITVIVVDCDRETVDSEPTREGFGDPEQVAEILGETPYFYYLSPTELQQVLQLAQPVRAQAGETVIADEEDNKRLFLILDGAVSLTLNGQPMSVLQKGEHFGEMALIDAQDDHDHNLVVQARERSSFLTIGRDRFVGLFEKNQSLALKLLWNFAQVFASRLQQVPAQYRYVGESSEAEPDAIADVTGAAPRPEDVPAAGEELSEQPDQADDQREEVPDDTVKAARDEMVTPPPQQEPSVRAGTGFGAAVEADGMVDADEGPPVVGDAKSATTDGESEKVADDEALRETLALESVSGPPSEPEEIAPPKLGAGSAISSDDDKKNRSQQSDPQQSDDSDEDDEAAIRSTMKLDWNEMSASLEQDRPDARSDREDADDQDGAADSRDENSKLEKLRGDSGKALRAKLRKRLGQRGGAKSEAKPGRGSVPEESTAEEPVVGKADAEESNEVPVDDDDGAGPPNPPDLESLREDEKPAAETQKLKPEPKVMVSSELLADSGDE